MSDNEVYYRIYKSQSGKYRVVCMQWFDEIDYDQKRFLNKTKFKTEEEAREFIENIFAMASKLALNGME